MEAIFQAVLKSRHDVTRVLRSIPGSAQARATSDVLIQSIPHWIYAGGTAGTIDEQLAIITLLIQHGANLNARDGAGRAARGYARHPRVIEALERGSRGGTCF